MKLALYQPWIYLHGGLERSLLELVSRRHDSDCLSSPTPAALWSGVMVLATCWPSAIPIFLIRDCLSWTDSMMNFLLNKPEFMTSRKPHIREHMTVQFGTPPYAPKEAVLKEKGLHPLSRYLDYWTYQNQKIIDAVPAGRLLALQTTAIDRSREAIEAFLGLAAHRLVEAIHSNSTPTRHSLLDNMPKAFVRAKVEAHCGKLMREFYPDVLEKLG